jgi:amino acid adenylation domain-containing protein
MVIKTDGTGYPASSNQKQFWVASRLQPDNSAYHIPSLFHITGNLDQEALMRSFDEITKRHDIYRNVFSTEDGHLLQLPTDIAPVQFTSISLEDIGLEQKEKKLQELVAEEVACPFDFEKGPLLRVSLFCLGTVEYYLLIVVHHIVNDLRTTKLFSEELSYIYNSFTTGKSVSLPMPEKCYKDYVTWQRDWFTSEEYEEMISKWVSRLGNHSGYLNLPTDYPRQPFQVVSGGVIRFSFSKIISGALGTFSKKHSVSNYLVLQAAYLILLYRYTSQNDIIIGTPLTNRRKEEHKNIFGCFVSILPLAFDVSGELSFEDVLRHVRQHMLWAHRIQEVPYEHIIKKLQLKRDLSYNPLFQVGFTFEPPMELDLRDLEVVPHKTHHGGNQLDLFLTLWEKAEEINGFLEYNAELYTEQTMADFVGHYQILLEGILKQPGDPIAKLPLLREIEKDRILEEWNRTASNLPEEPLLQSAFEVQVQNNPDAIALVFEKSNLTYQELNERSNQLAHYLQDLGVGPDTFVGVFMDRSIEMVVALLGVVKAGAAYLPLDPNFPEDRLSFMLEDSNASLVLTQQHLSESLNFENIHKINMDGEFNLFKHQPTSNLKTSILPENLVYVMYTSGSTGKPKGVQIPHVAVVNFLLSMSREPGLVQSDVLLAVTTLSFDISVLELFLPLTVGATVIIASRDDAVNGQKLLALIETSGATVMQATPTTWYLLLAAGWEGTKNFKVLCGGEPMPLDLAQQLVRRSKDVWNLYGPTETTVWSTIYRVPADVKEVLVGKPIANTQLYIVNEKDQPNPVGVAGELLIGGIGVSRGYLNRPELTDEKFMPDHIGKNSEERLYRTGDFACYLPDGNVKLFGRMDNQVKLRGFRIELGEIETVLERSASIDKAVVLVREDVPGDRRLVAYVTIEDSSDYSEVRLRQYLKRNLPAFMVPSNIVVMDKMPLTPNKKIDRKSLPPPDLKRPDLESQFELPHNELERQVSRIWSSLLKIDQIGTHDNFFELGGDSLRCVQLAMMLEKELKKKVPVVKIFQYPTIKAFSDYLDHKDMLQSTLEDSVQSRIALQRKVLLQRKKNSVNKIN